MNWLRVQNILWMMLISIVALTSISAYSYSLRGEMRTYYLDDIWSEEMFIEPVKDSYKTNSTAMDTAIHLTKMMQMLGFMLPSTC